MPLHLRLATVAVVLSISWATAAADLRRPITLPGCPDKCGNISIPYPFGTKDGCYFDDTFSVTCNLSTTPPATLNDLLTLRGIGYYFGDQANPIGTRTNRSWWTVDLINVDVTRGEARVSMPFSSDCSLNESYHELNLNDMSLNFSTTFLFSATQNVLVGVGQSVRARVFGDMARNNYSAACNSLFDTPAVAQDGLCKGLGCCQAELAPGLVGIMPSMYYQSNSMWKTFPCTYSMVVDRSWYNFSLQDLYGYKVLDKRFPGGAPVVLDWAIRNGSCPAEGKPLPMACRSGNSLCVNATNGYGYLCKCKDGFDGNPYIPDGCQDIDECALRQEKPELRDSYPCNGICKNLIGGYDCNCKFGMKRDSNGTCTPVFPIPAMLLFEEKRKTKEFFIKNGGPILEKVNNIKIFKKDELKAIIEPCNVIGKGGFGEVYKGLLDNQLVAIKKSINVDRSQEKQFANEIIIQSRVIHKNIVKLIGCCLEVDVPMLVYEFVPQGSLHDILHNQSNNVSLSLGTRLNIAAGAAEGLSYMHSKTSTTILHGDIKPGNILLDDNFDPKISDFGISRLIAIDKSHTKCVIGDMCYMDPIYLQSGLLTKKSDVYSFGVVLLELLSRQKAAFGEDRTLVKAFLDCYREDKQVLELFDKEILADKDIGVLHKLAMLIVECLELNVDRRPEMTDVAERLHSLKRSHKN
uniref:Protein kinase domain-containing protein n=1 Tax=Setaria italica TaxID=4555 RepID=K4ALQ2_SETIT